MFEMVEEKIHKSSRNKNLRTQMTQSLPQIYNALFPPLDVLAMETRMQLTKTGEDFKEWALKNPDQVDKQRAIFKEVLQRFKSISQRIDDIL